MEVAMATVPGQRDTIEEAPDLEAGDGLASRLRWNQWNGLTAMAATAHGAAGETPRLGLGTRPGKSANQDRQNLTPIKVWGA